jgi:1-pyrroline-5-carboxylate dehydrogenase
VCTQVSIVVEQLLRLLHHCGMPRTDADLIHGSGQVVNELLLRAQPRSTLFTGSQRVAEKLAVDLKGKVCFIWGGGVMQHERGGEV